MKTSIVAIIVIVIVIIAGVGGYSYYLSTRTTTTPTPTPSHHFKIAVILPSESNDFGWNQDMAEAIAQVQPIYGYNFTIDQNVGYSTSAVESAFEYYASNGYNIIVAWTVGWQPQILAVAPNYPKTYFVAPDLSNFSNPNTGANETNIINFDVNLNWGAYAAGILAAMLTKTGVIGYQAGYSYPAEDEIGYAFAAGAKTVNPNIKFVYDFPGTWSDVAAGSVGTKSLIADGADIVLFRGDGQTLGGEQALFAAGDYAIGDMFDQSPLNPSLLVASNTYNDSMVLQFVINHYLTGTMSQIADKVHLTLPQASTLTLGPAVNTLLTPQQLQELKTVIAELKNGTIVPPTNSTLLPSGSPVSMY